LNVAGAMERRTESQQVLHLLPHLSASAFPCRVAVRSEGRQISYQELDALSDAVAAALQSLGVAKGDRVGIYLPKSVSSVVSIYSILKCGGVYVPFDPDAPAERLALIAKNCGIQAVMTNSSKLGGLEAVASEGAPIASAVLVDYDLEAAAEAPRPGGRLKVLSWKEASGSGKPSVVPVSPDDTAYILYTSGSTGVPKGVTISHRNSMSFVVWAAECLGLKEDDVVVCHAPLHFDISVFSVFSTCRAGGTVLMLPDRASTFPAQLSSLIEREGVTVWYSVPSVLILLTLYGSLSKRELSKLRAVVFAGEVFPAKYLRQLIAMVPRPRYLNWYGPTETNVCTSYEVEKGSDILSAPPIGRACSYAETFAMTDDGRLVSGPGESGELYVGGPTVMQGYWADPEKTAKLLVDDPRAPGSGVRFYKTGDLVTLDGGGNYLYLGRRDGMVKTRGYRVELGEVEAAIYQHPAVREAVVVAVPDELVGNRLHAFVSPNVGADLTKEDVLAFCGGKLPKYMVPDSMSFMTSIPKTSNGKMDRVALAEGVLRGAGTS